MGRPWLNGFGDVRGPAHVGVREGPSGPAARRRRMPSKEPVRLSDKPVGAIKELVVDLLGQALENDLGGGPLYAAALRSAQDQGLRELWTASLAASGDRVRVLKRALVALGIDPAQETL